MQRGGVKCNVLSCPEGEDKTYMFYSKTSRDAEPSSMSQHHKQTTIFTKRAL